MTEPEAEAPQASADYRPELAPPISDGFYRAIGEYARAENAKAEPNRIRKRTSLTGKKPTPLSIIVPPKTPGSGVNRNPSRNRYPSPSRRPRYDPRVPRPGVRQGGGLLHADVPRVLVSGP